MCMSRVYKRTYKTCEGYKVLRLAPDGRIIAEYFTFTHGWGGYKAGVEYTANNTRKGWIKGSWRDVPVMVGPTRDSKYKAGFHIFLRPPKVKFTKQDVLVKVQFSEVTAFGSQRYYGQSNEADHVPCAVAEKMTILGECYSSGNLKPKGKRRI